MRYSAADAAVRFLVMVVWAAGCGGDGVPAPALEPLGNPAPPGSAQPGLTVSPNGALLLSWQVREPDSSFSLHFVTREPQAAGGWSAERKVETGPGMLGSATDVPSVIQLSDAVVVAAWRGKHGARGYDVVLAHSTDSGRTWSAPRSPHRDSTLTEHGFVSWLEVGGHPGLVWVDGRGNDDPDTARRATRLAYAQLDSAGEASPETFLDLKICNCCHTSAAPVAGGAVVAYRDRADGEIRDISTIRWGGGRWGTPVTVHDDGWHIAGCPVNGPALSARSADVAVAWFTAAGDTARVRLAFSADTAATFGPPIEINAGRAEGNVGVVLMPGGDALVSWIEARGARSVLRIRRVTTAGRRSSPVDVAEFPEGKRAGGMPRFVLAPDGTEAILTWTDPANHRVATGRVRLR